MVITFKGKPITLVGRQLSVGDTLPSFALCANDLSPVHSRELKGLKVFLSVPSVDTGVCDAEVRRFNEQAANLPGVHVYAVSMDLPFAQKRWCAAADIQAVQVLSDYQERQFGQATGTLIDELKLLTRAVFVVDEQGKVLYAQYVGEVSEHPDYDAAFAALKQAMQG